jgi:hypothetical protein
MFQVPGRMGLLITLYLIMMNTFSAVQKASPKDRSFGFIELWIVGCQSCILFAMTEYGIILYQIKSEHETGCQKYKKKLYRGICCKNRRFESWDHTCLLVIPTVFVLFNILFWCYVWSLQIYIRHQKNSP